MLEADIFCSQVKGNLAKSRRLKDEELRLKIGQCREVLAYLQGIYEDGNLTIDYGSVPEAFRHLVKSLMWVAFHFGRKIDSELFRELVHIQENITSLLIEQLRCEAKRS